MADGTHFNAAEVVDLAAERISRRWLEPVACIPPERAHVVRVLSFVPVCFDVTVSAGSPEEAAAKGLSAVQGGLVSGVVMWGAESTRKLDYVFTPAGKLIRQV